MAQSRKSDPGTTPKQRALQYGTGPASNKPGRKLNIVELAKKIGIDTKDGDDLVAFAVSVFKSNAPDMSVTFAQRWAAFEWLSDRFYGKAPQVIEQAVTVEIDARVVDYGSMSDEELEAIGNLDALLTKGAIDV